MLHQWLRIFFSDNGALTDYSLQNQNETETVPVNLTTGEDYIYIGQHFPFNNFFCQVETENVVSSEIALQYWDGTQWRSAVDVLDGTSTGGISLARDGVVQFSPDRDHSWNRVFDTTLNGEPPELSSLTIYNLYWARISFNATLTIGAKLKRFAYAFTSSQQIDNLDNRINDYLGDFATGKTEWNDEIITASIQVANDLKSRGLIVDKNQIIRFDDVSMPTDWRTLMLIYRNLGGDWESKLKAAEQEYTKSLQLRRFTFDTDGDAVEDSKEIHGKVGSLVR